MNKINSMKGFFASIMGTLTSIYISNVVLMNFNLRDEK